MVLSICAYSQDIHYSQFYNSPAMINPSLTGLFDGDHRFIINHRDQWRFVPVPWTTFTGAYDKAFYRSGSDRSRFGLGGSINYDRQGDSKLTLFSLQVNGGYHFAISNKSTLSLGANVGFANRGFNTRALRWDKQWNGETFDLNAPSQEQFQNNESVSFLESGVGVNYRYQKSARTSLDIGAAALHLIEPKANFINAEATKLPRRYTLNAVANIKLIEELDLQLHVLHQIQGKYNETVFGGVGKIYLNQNKGKQLQLHLGLGYRTSKSLIPIIAFQVNNWYLSGNLDIDSTPYNDALNSTRGAYELHLRYIIKNVRPFRARNCDQL